MPENFEMQADFSIFVRMDRGEIIIYRTADGETRLEVRMESDSVWLTQAQIARLFGVDRTVIVRHVNNIYKSCELEREATCAKIAHVQHEGLRQVRRMIPYYNLDMILSIGYRVNSKNATQFRIWANKVLKEYLVKGYVISNNITEQKYRELQQLVAVMARTVKRIGDTAGKDHQTDSLVSMVADYAYALDTLDRYDYQQLEVGGTTTEERFHATYDNAMKMIDSLRRKFGGGTLFGNEKDGSFRSSIGQIYQTFGGTELYPSIEEKAAMLLYLVTKNHSFSDGNKRIAATLFLWFLERNGILYRPDGGKRIADNALVALTLMIAESRTEEKDTIVKVVVNLINKNNR